MPTKQEQLIMDHIDMLDQLELGHIHTFCTSDDIQTVEYYNVVYRTSQRTTVAVPMNTNYGHISPCTTMFPISQPSCFFAPNLPI